MLSVSVGQNRRGRRGRKWGTKSVMGRQKRKRESEKEWETKKKESEERRV